jgi:hypothetical protein
MQPGRRKWDPAFSKKRKLAYNTNHLAENQSYVDELASSTVLTSQVLQCIVDYEDPFSLEAGWACKAQKLWEIFRGVDEEDLDSPEKWPHEKRAWLDDRLSQSSRPRSRESAHNDMMSAHELFTALMTPVGFRRIDSVSIESS